MFDIATLMNLACVEVELKAREQGREATGEEYRSALDKTWNTWMDAAVTRDMTKAGFVKTASGWESPRRGFWAWLLGR